MSVGAAQPLFRKWGRPVDQVIPGVGGEQRLDLLPKFGLPGTGQVEIHGPLGGDGNGQGCGKNRFVRHVEPPRSEQLVSQSHAKYATGTHHEFYEFTANSDLLQAARRPCRGSNKAWQCGSANRLICCGVFCWSSA